MPSPRSAPSIWTLAIRNGHFGEGLYRTAVALAAISQDIRVGSLAKTRYRGLGFWINVITAIGAFAFLWWLSRPDLRHPYGRLRRGEFWEADKEGLGGTSGDSGEGWAGRG